MNDRQLLALHDYLWTIYGILGGPTISHIVDQVRKEAKRYPDVKIKELKFSKDMNPINITIEFEPNKHTQWIKFVI